MDRWGAMAGVQRVDLSLQGAMLLQPAVHGDERGFFQETFRGEWAALGIEEEWVQDNHSRSARGVVRGMHFQGGEGQAKLVRCARGAIFDAIVDIRPGSPTYGRWDGVELDDRNLHVLYVPVGFAHGFCVVSELADVTYKCSSYYDPALEGGFAYDDPDVGIEWPDLELTPSARDASAPRLREIADSLPFSFPG